jgi:hypothetical protein
MAASVVWWSEFLATDPEVRVRFPVLPGFLRSSGSGTVSTQSHEYNWGATWKKSSGSGLENREYGRMDLSRWPRGPLYPQKFALTSPASSDRSVGIVRLRTQATELSLILLATLGLLSLLLLHCNATDHLTDSWLTHDSFVCSVLKWALLRTLWLLLYMFCCTSAKLFWVLGHPQSLVSWVLPLGQSRRHEMHTHTVQHDPPHHA